MISLPNPTNKMTLSNDQLRKLIEAYAERVVDNMDVRDLCAFAMDTIVDNMIDYNEAELMDELSIYYDEDELNELVESVTSD
jgi:ribosome assembly protein YihI (activator of Der GTPase)